MADVAEALAERVAAGDGPRDSRPRHHLSVRRINRKMRVSAELNDAAAALIEGVAGSGVKLTSLNVVETTRCYMGGFAAGVDGAAR